ncbi:hypothetical protein ACFQ1I_40650 [Kitasatospora arboriphila]
MRVETTLSALAAQLRPSRPGPLVPVLPALHDLLPERGLRPGTVVSVGGDTSLMLALAAAATTAGTWCAAVGLQGLGLVAAAELGVALDRLLLAENPGERWPEVATALADAVGIMLLRPTGTVAARSPHACRRWLGAPAARWWWPVRGRAPRCAWTWSTGRGSGWGRAAAYPGAADHRRLRWAGRRRRRTADAAVAAGRGRRDPPRRARPPRGRGTGPGPVRGGRTRPAGGGVMAADPENTDAPRALVVWCPDWPVTAVLGTDLDPARAAAVVERGRVLAATDAARAAGARRGQKVRTAQSTVAGLELHDRDLDAEARLFEQVAHTVTGLAPHLEVLRPGICAIPARGPARFHGGEDRLVEKVIDAVEAAGFECRVGIADGLAAARLAARSHRVVPPGESARFLARFPVGELADEKLADLLVRLGLPTIGQFAALPAGSVADRFGPAGVAAHRAARGLEARPVVARPPGFDLTAEERFEEPHLLAEPLVFAARVLAERLHTGLAAAGLACRRFEVEVQCADGTVASRAWRHEGALSIGAVAERVRWQLQAWQHRALFSAAAAARSHCAWCRTAWSPTRAGSCPCWTATGRPPTASNGPSPASRRSSATPASSPSSSPRPRPRRPGGPHPVGRRAPGAARRRAVARTPARTVARLRAARPRAGAAAGRRRAGSPGDRPRGGPRAARPPDPRRPGGRGDRLGRAVAATERWWDTADARRTARLQVTLADGRALLLAVEGGRWRVEGAYDS